MRIALVLCLAAAPATADVSSALTDHVLPGYAMLAQETEHLSVAAAQDCTLPSLTARFNSAYDAWVAVSHLQLGPVEDEGLLLAMSFWPDTKDRTGKALTRLTASNDPIVDDPTKFDDVSAAAQGFTALERVLYGAASDADYTCRLTRAIAKGLAEKSDRLFAQWPDFAALMQTAGEPGNTRFQNPQEAQRALYTALSTGLEFMHDQRLGRPLGTFERPRPNRAEARRSERSLRHIQISLTSLEQLAFSLSDDALPKTKAAFSDARTRADTIDDPALAGVADPISRFRIEALQQSVREIQIAIVEEIGSPLGITAGFNALDGD
ncbi:MAG: imelysin family protein [Roseobacter sp.]